MKAGSQHSGKDTPFLAEINMIPFIDVVLVLLIIFMIITPYMVMNTIKVNLPKSVSTAQPPSKTITVTIQESGSVYINNEPVVVGDIADRIMKLSKESPDGAVVFSDKTVKIETVVDVIDRIEAGGVHKINLTTEHKEAPLVPTPEAAPAGGN